MPTIVNLNQPISDRTDPRLVPISRSGGSAINGQEQVVSPLTSVWKWRIVLPINTIGRARAWRAVNAQLKGRFNYLRASACDQYRIGRRSVGAVYDGDQVPYGDGAFHSDGTGFALAQPIASVLGPAVRGDTTITIDAAPFNGAMSAGVFFSVNEYLHVVTDWAEDSGVISLTFEPGLRVPVNEGDEADFNAKSVWVLDTDDAGSMPLRLGRFGEVELNLTESYRRSE